MSTTYDAGGFIQASQYFSIGDIIAHQTSDINT